MDKAMLGRHVARPAARTQLTRYGSVDRTWVMSSTREAHTLLLVHDTKRIHAGIGISEPLLRPDVTVEACVGRREANGPYIVGEALVQAVTQGEAVEIIYPITDGDVNNWDALEALWYYVLHDKLGVRVGNNAYYIMLALPSPVSRDVYEQGAKILFEKFNSPAITISEVPLLSAYALGVLTALVVDVGAEDSSAVAVSDCAVVPSGVVISKIGIVHCTWWLAYLLTQDARVMQALEQVAPGQTHAAAWSLAQQMADDHVVCVDTDITQTDDEDEGVLDVAAALVEGRERDVVKERERQKEAEAKSAASNTSGAVVVSFRGVEVPVGSVHKRFHEPLFRPAVLERVSLDIPTPRAVAQALQARRIGGEPMCLSIPDAVARATANVHPMERRLPLWENLILTGPMALTRGLIAELTRALSAYTTTESSEASQVVGDPQPWKPHHVRALRIPDYFANYKERMDLAPYLGATIFAKLVFGDLSGRNYITKRQYNEGGPSVAFALGSL